MKSRKGLKGGIEKAISTQPPTTQRLLRQKEKARVFTKLDCPWGGMNPPGFEKMKVGQYKLPVRKLVLMENEKKRKTRFKEDTSFTLERQKG